MESCLVVDDSSVIRKVAKRILGGAQLAVLEAGSGSEGLQVCRSRNPNLIIVDCKLPDMSAVDFIREAVALAGDEKPRIAVCVTEVDVGTIMRAKRAGAKGYILKPFNRAQLLERFRMLQSVN